MRERITIEAAQPLIGLPIRTVQAMAAKGEIPGAAKMRRRWTFDRVKLEGWIVQKEQETWQNAQRPPVVIGEGLSFGGGFKSKVSGFQNRLTQMIQRSLNADSQKSRQASKPTPTTATASGRSKRRIKGGTPISPDKSTMASSGRKLELVTSSRSNNSAPTSKGGR
jgi:hypothetical protein